MDFKFREFFYPSNLLSISRVILLIPIVYYIRLNTPEGNLILLVLALAGVATDFLDGYLSRRMGQVTDLGKILDPIADKIVMAVVFVALIYYRGFPLPLAIILIYRDVMILLIGSVLLRKTGKPVMANFWGKLNTSIIAVACILFMVNVTNWLYEISLLASYAIVFVSGFSYYRVGERMLFDQSASRWWFRLVMLIMTGAVLYLAWLLR